jgi:hypothetical protein
MSDKSTPSSVDIPSDSIVVPDWLDWNFDAHKDPFDKTVDSNGNIIEAAVKEKQDIIAEHARQELLLRGGAQWSVTCVWTVLDAVSLMYNMKAVISKPGLTGNGDPVGIGVALAHNRATGTPPPPPQPPPPNL